MPDHVHPSLNGYVAIVEALKPFLDFGKPVGFGG